MVITTLDNREIEVAFSLQILKTWNRFENFDEKWLRKLKLKQLERQKSK
nr:hypothetical protein [Mycoplasmopsis bovis]